MSRTRRSFLRRASALSAAPSLSEVMLSAANASGGTEKPALLGGPKVRPQAFPSWPVSGEPDAHALIDTLRGGKWYRGNGQQTRKFEEAFRNLTGARHCLATANGTSALYVSLNAVGIEPVTR